MTEALFQFIWQFQYYTQSDLTLLSGEKLEIIHQGNKNYNQGPDFLEASIRIEGTTWFGNIELHIRQEDWQKHGHEGDLNYRNVILHVVWEEPIDRGGLPTLCLQSRVPKTLLGQYEQWMMTTAFVPCAGSLNSVPELTRISWVERMSLERLKNKATIICSFLEQCNFHWEEVFWWLMARNYGIKVNADAFEAIAKSLPLSIIARHKNQIHQLEALLFGQANMLFRKFEEQYPDMLRKEYIFLRKKYGLRPISLPLHMLRMRPQNFPTVRLGQLAALIHSSKNLFAGIRSTEKLSELFTMLEVTANDYWHYHYVFDQVSSFQPKKPGPVMIRNIIVNTIIPVLFTYGEYHRDDTICEKALDWLRQLPPENNLVIRNWEKAGLRSSSASESQGLIELKSNYCDLKRCLECGLGTWIIRRD